MKYITYGNFLIYNHDSPNLYSLSDNTSDLVVSLDEHFSPFSAILQTKQINQEN